MDVVRTPPQGWIEVIVGSMFSGKSEELIRRLRRAQIARQRVQIFKPAVDTRYADDHIVSHSELRIPSEQAGVVRRPAGARCAATPRWSASTRDSSSTPALPAACVDAGRPRRAGDRRRARPGLPRASRSSRCRSCWPIAEYITKTRAICMVCGNPANHTQRLVAEHRPRAARRARAPTRRGAGAASIRPCRARNRPARRRRIDDAGRSIAESTR